jgi:hypothetical protein
MKRTHGLVSLAVLHHVTDGFALLAMLAGLLNSNSNLKLIFVLQVCAFGFFSLIIRRGWASIEGGAENLSPAKAQGFLWIPFFNLYWGFRALVSLATQTNAKADAEQNPDGRITRGFGLVIAVLCCVLTLTSLLTDQHAFFAWIDFIIYATYYGFAVTYIWQIRRSAEAFEARSAPALREPTKMPTVGVAGIIYGSGLVALLILNLNFNFWVTPEVIDQRLKSKGYTTRVSDRTGLSGFIDRAVLKEAGIIEINELRVYRGDERVAGVFVATGNLSANSEQLVAARLATRTLRNGDKIFFKAYIREPEQENMDINQWLSSF